MPDPRTSTAYLTGTGSPDRLLSPLRQLPPGRRRAGRSCQARTRTSVSLWSRVPGARPGPEPNLRSCGYLSQPVGGSFPGERRSPYLPPPHRASACHASPAARPIGQRGWPRGTHARRAHSMSSRACEKSAGVTPSGHGGATARPAGRYLLRSG